MFRARRFLCCLLLVNASCKSTPPVADAALDQRLSEAAPADRQRGEADRSLPSLDGPVACPNPPCAERPIIFVHGFTGSNDDWFWLLGELEKSDLRWDGHELAGREDHATWAPRSIPRAHWLFAFDYYVKLKTDARGSYTAGPGRIGSNVGHNCTSPTGKGYIIGNNIEYDQGVTHDYSADLAAFVDSARRATGADSVDMVAHSMGGMIVRSYLSFFAAARVKKVLLLASPVTGVSQAGLYALVPFGHPSWMNKHEIAEIDGGSLLSPVRFLRCEESPQTLGAWGQKLLDAELLSPPPVELHVMSGSADLFITYQVAHHPLALTHVVVDADHSGTLKRPEVAQRIRDLLGGSL